MHFTSELDLLDSSASREIQIKLRFQFYFKYIQYVDILNFVAEKGMHSIAPKTASADP